MCRFSFAPTDCPDDTSLATPCKGFGTENLETFCKYLRNAYTVGASSVLHANSLRSVVLRTVTGCWKEQGAIDHRAGEQVEKVACDYPVEEAPGHSREQEIPPVQERKRSAEGRQQDAQQGAAVEPDDAPLDPRRDDDPQEDHEGNPPDLVPGGILGEEGVAEQVLCPPRHHGDGEGRARETDRADRDQ